MNNQLTENQHQRGIKPCLDHFHTLDFDFSLRERVNSPSSLCTGPDPEGAFSGTRAGHGSSSMASLDEKLQDTGGNEPSIW